MTASPLLLSGNIPGEPRASAVGAEPPARPIHAEVSR